MNRVALYMILPAAVPLFAEVPTKPAQDLSLHTARVRGVEVSFVDYHWQPELFEAMEDGSGTVPEARRDWVLARVAVEPDPMKVHGVDLRAGSYALSLFPNRDGNGMAIELRQVDVRRLFVNRNVMAPTPPGQTMYRAPADFDLLDPPTPRLDITATETADGVLLTVKYGNRRLSLALAR
jgi:hypothetical protein